VGGQLKATPARLLTGDDRTFIKEHRAEILTLLTAPAEAPPVVKQAKRKVAAVVPTVTEPLPTGAHGVCPVCSGRRWRLRSTPQTGGAWLWVCAACADRVHAEASHDEAVQVLTV